MRERLLAAARACRRAALPDGLRVVPELRLDVGDVLSLGDEPRGKGAAERVRRQAFGQRIAACSTCRALARSTAASTTRCRARPSASRPPRRLTVYFLKRLSRSTPPSFSIRSTTPPFGPRRSAPFSGQSPLCPRLSRLRSRLRSTQSSFAPFCSATWVASFRAPSAPSRCRRGTRRARPCRRDTPSGAGREPRSCLPCRWRAACPGRSPCRRPR
jgi:hypothetical protein